MWFLVLDWFLQTLRSKLRSMQEDQIEWIKKVKVYRICEKCKSGELSTRVPRSFFFKYIVFWAAYKRYRCDYCKDLVHIRQ